MKEEHVDLFLEHVPNGHPLDFLYFNLGHTKACNRTDLSIDPGSMALVFHDSSYDIFLEREKWLSSGQRILEYILANDERVEDWKRKVGSSLARAIDFNNALKGSDSSSASSDVLATRLCDVVTFQTALTFENAEIVSPNYGTDLIQGALKATLRELGEHPVSTVPILLESSEEVPFIAYEKDIARYAIELSAQGITDISSSSFLDEHITTIVSKYDWIDANLNNPPKSSADVRRDMQHLLDQGPALADMFDAQEKQKRDALAARDALTERLRVRANMRQRRVIAFAIQSSRFGRMLVDEEMRMIFYVRKLHTDIASRLGVSLVQLKYLLAEEIRDCLLSASKPDADTIRERMELSVYILEGDTISVRTGEKASEYKKRLDAVRSDSGDVSDMMSGEVAFGTETVRGTARLVHDVGDMEKIGPGDILVSSRTYPDLLPAMRRSAAIVSELGGLLSHAAIVARELKIPTIVGVRNAMSRIQDGDMIEVDTIAGNVRKI